MFLLHELTHFVLSLMVGWIFFRYYRSFWVYLAAFLGGFFLDVDHLFDYFRFRAGLNFNLEQFLSSQYFDAAHKIYLIFHGYEYAALTFIIGLIILIHAKKSAKNKSVVAFVLFAFSLSIFAHLLFDQLSYKPKPLAYSIIYRASLNFDHDGLGFKKHEK